MHFSFSKGSQLITVHWLRKTLAWPAWVCSACSERLFTPFRDFLTSEISSSPFPVLIGSFQRCPDVQWPRREPLPVRDPHPSPALPSHPLTCSRLSISARNPENKGTSNTAMFEDPECSHLPMGTKREKNGNKLKIQLNQWTTQNGEASFRRKKNPIKRLSSLKGLWKASLFGF